MTSKCSINSLLCRGYTHLVRGVVRRRRAFRGLKTSFGKIGRCVCMLIFLQFFRTSQTTPMRTLDEKIAHVVRFVRFPRPRKRTTPRTEKSVPVAAEANKNLVCQLAYDYILNWNKMQINFNDVPVKMRLRPGSVPNLAGEVYSAPPDRLAAVSYTHLTLPTILRV